MTTDSYVSPQSARTCTDSELASMLTAAEGNLATAPGNAATLDVLRAEKARRDAVQPFVDRYLAAGEAARRAQLAQDFDAAFVHLNEQVSILGYAKDAGYDLNVHTLDEIVRVRVEGPTELLTDTAFVSDFGRRMEAMRAVARWEIGDAAWADRLMNAFRNPDYALASIAAQRDR